MNRIETIYVVAAELECPACKHRFSDKLGDPRGLIIACPECEQPLTVDAEADFEFELDR